MTNSQEAQALDMLQKRFWLSNVGGQLRVLDGDQVSKALAGVSNDGVHFFALKDADLLMRRFLETQPIGAFPAAVVKVFKDHPATLVVDQVAFSPLPMPPTTLNLWAPPAAMPTLGDWSTLKHFLKTVLCNDDPATFGYLFRYLAHMVQHPEEKPGVMLVFLGGQGTGKGMFFRLLERIWPRTTLLVSDMDQVLGKFNAALERSYVVCLDEALFFGDRKAQDKLKSLVSEPTIRVEEKHQPARQTTSLHRLFAASNHDHFAQVERDDRRMVVIKVSSTYQQDTTYFKKVYAAIQDQRTIDALFYELTNFDISDFNVRIKPATTELAMQKIKSLSGFDRYWYEVLTTGYLAPAGSKVMMFSLPSENNQWTDSMFVATSSLIERYRHFDPTATRHQTIQQNTVHQRLRTLCRSAKSDRQTVESFIEGASDVKRGFLLPDLAQARKDFEAFIGGKLDWDGDAIASGGAEYSGEVFFPSDMLWLTDLQNSLLCHPLPVAQAAGE